MVAMKLTAVNGPTPGIVIIKRQAPLCRATRPSCFAMASCCSRNVPSIASRLSNSAATTGSSGSVART